MNQELKQWLDDGGRQYQAGVQLVLKYSSDPRLHQLFSEHETEYKRQRLKKAIHELFQQVCPKKTSARQGSLSASPKAAGVHGGWPAGSQDPVIQALYARFKPLYSELMNLQARIYDVAIIAENGDPNKQIEAAEMAHRILDLDDELEKIYSDRDTYLLEGRLPTDKHREHQVADPVRWVLELRNNERYIREYKNKIKKFPDVRKAVKWAQKLKDLEDEVTRLKGLLKIDQ